MLSLPRKPELFPITSGKCDQDSYLGFALLICFCFLFVSPIIVLTGGVHNSPALKQAGKLVNHLGCFLLSKMLQVRSPCRAGGRMRNIICGPDTY